MVGAVLVVTPGELGLGSGEGASADVGRSTGWPPQAATSSSAGSHLRMGRRYGDAAQAASSVAAMSELHDLTALEQGAAIG